MPRKKEQPAPGGAIQSDTPEIRGPVKDMLAAGSDDNFLSSLPENTSTEGATNEPKTRKPRRSKEEMARAKGKNADAPVDARLERAKAKAAGLGGGSLVKSGFEMSGKPLNSEESEDVDDQFYLIASKAGIDPSGSWFFLILYTVALLARLVLSRTDLGEQVRMFLERKKGESENGNEQQKSAEGKA